MTTAATPVGAEAATTSTAETLAGGRPGEAVAARAEELYERHGSTVLGLCRVLLRNNHEAEDATQQTFLSAYRSLLNGAEPRHPAAWLATIARNECWATIEKRMRRPLPAELEGDLPDPVAAAAEKADLRELWRAIGELPRQQRKALLLREFSGLSYDELALALGVSEPAVESLLFRARRELRRRLRPVYGSAVVAPWNAFKEALAPLAVKVGAGATAVVVAGGTVAAVETTRVLRTDGSPPAIRVAIARPASRTPARALAPARVAVPFRPATRPPVAAAPVVRPRSEVAGPTAVRAASYQAPARTPPAASGLPGAIAPPAPAAPPIIGPGGTPAADPGEPADTGAATPAGEDSATGSSPSGSSADDQGGGSPTGDGSGGTSGSDGGSSGSASADDSVSSADTGGSSDSGSGSSSGSGGGDSSSPGGDGAGSGSPGVSSDGGGQDSVGGQDGGTDG